jgi:glycosyltransferase involved in cell wall biosynthesis
LLTVARLAYQKGVDVLLRAVADLRTEGWNVQCTIVGGGYRESAYEQELRDYVSSRDLTDSVVFAGLLSPEGVARYMASSDLYVQPSRYESQGIAVLEAMASGLPIVATAIEAIEDNVKVPRNGILTPVGDSGAMARTIGHLLENPVLMDLMRHANVEDAKNRTWATTREKTVACLLVDGA